MTAQTLEATRYEVSIGEEKERFDSYMFGQLVTKAEFEAEFVGAGNEACDFAWTSETTAEWYSWDVMSQEDGSEAKEWIHYVAELWLANSLLNELTNLVERSLDRFSDEIVGDYDVEDWESVHVEVFDDSFFFITEDGTYGSVQGLRIVPAGDPSIPLVCDVCGAQDDFIDHQEDEDNSNAHEFINAEVAAHLPPQRPTITSRTS